MLSKSKKIVITGLSGQLGFDVYKELKNRGYVKVFGIDIDNLDISDEKAVHEFVNNYKPDIIMHNAAWTAVDKAEENEEKVYAVNSFLPALASLSIVLMKLLPLIPKTHDIRMIQYSLSVDVTKSSPFDFVFPYTERPFFGEPTSKKFSPFPSKT